MMNTSTSEARQQANRQNALKSTGPKTPEGKANSRQNSLKHGLTAMVLDLDPDPDFDRELGPLPAELAPTMPIPQEQPEGARSGPGWEPWLNEQVARVMAQIARAQRIEARLRDMASLRAMEVWEDDRKLLAEELGAKLKRDPSRTVARLRQTLQGCDWLGKRWGWLAEAAESCNEGWTEAQTHLALDLLGIPEAGRSNPNFERGPLGCAQAMVTELQSQRDLLFEVDRASRSLAENDFDDVPTPELARIRRYEQALYRRLQWLLVELRSEAPAPQYHQPPGPVETPERNEANAPDPLDETKPTPPDPKVKITLEPPPSPPRNRPNLAKIARRDRQKSKRFNQHPQPA